MIEFNGEKNLTYRIKTSLWLACSSDFVAYQRNWNWTREQGLRNKKFTTYAISGYFCVKIMRIGSCWLGETENCQITHRGKLSKIHGVKLSKIRRVQSSNFLLLNSYCNGHSVQLSTLAESRGGKLSKNLK